MNTHICRIVINNGYKGSKKILKRGGIFVFFSFIPTNETVSLGMNL